MSDVDIKEQVLLFLGKGKKYKKEQIVKYIGQNIDNILDEMELDGLIYKNSHGLYTNFPDHLIYGVIHFNSKDAFVNHNKNKYKIKESNLGEVLDGDTVIIKPTNNKEHMMTIAKIDKVLKRKTGNIIVEVREKYGEKYVEVLTDKFSYPVVLPNKELKNYSYGDRLLVNIGLPEENQKFYKGEIIRFICDKNDPDKDVKTIMVRRGRIIGHSIKAIEEANTIPDYVREEDKVGRIDFTNYITVSMDKRTCKDRDDAFTITRLPNGNYQIIVFISAVAYYVKPGMVLWDEALEKGFSCYPLEYVDPMLPKKLSNGICSLDENVERLAEAHVIEIDTNGEIVDYNYVPGVIKSNKACANEDVNKMLEDYEMVEGYEEVYPLLKMAEEICLGKLEERMIKRGLLDFKSTDLSVSTNDNGETDYNKEKYMGKAERITEILMVLTDELAANWALFPMIFRIHEEPDPRVVKQAIDELKEMGIDLNFSPNKNKISQYDIQNILKQVKDTPYEEIVSNFLIKAMKMAMYSAINIGHFALALYVYIQITSPIRRGGDLWNQYYMNEQRAAKKYSQKEFNELYEKAYKLSGHLTEEEIRCEKIEFDAYDAIIPRYYIKNQNEILNATITYLSKNRINIKTEHGIKGTLSLSDKHVYNKEDKCYIDKENKYKLVIGDHIEVVPKDLQEDKKIIFSLKK